MYKCDERFGPGVQTYTDSSQDVGLWHRERPVKILTKIDDAFSIHQTEYKDSSEDNHPMYIYPEYFQNRTDIIDGILNPPDQFSYPPNLDLSSKADEKIFNEFLNRKSLAIDIRAFDEAFFKEAIVSRVPSRTGSDNKGSSRKMSSQSNGVKENAEGVEETVEVKEETTEQLRSESPKKTGSGSRYVSENGFKVDSSSKVTGKINLIQSGDQRKRNVSNSKMIE